MFCTFDSASTGAASKFRSPLELRSDRRETSGKRVSDDLQLSIFDAKFFFSKIFSVFRNFRQILEELGFFGRQNQVPRWILLQIHFIFRSMRHLEPFLEATKVFLRPHGMSMFGRKECPSSNTRNVLPRTQGMFFFEHEASPSSDTRNVFPRTHGMFFFEHKECLSSNTRSVFLRT